MKRTTVVLSSDLALLAEREARRRGVSLSEVVRRALAAHLGVAEGQPRRIPFAAIGRSGKRHTARDAEEILAREWAGARRR